MKRDFLSMSLPEKIVMLEQTFRLHIQVITMALSSIDSSKVAWDRKARHIGEGIESFMEGTATIHYAINIEKLVRLFAMKPTQYF